MHLETIQHLRNVATQHDDLVPIAKPLLLDLLDSYERHALRSLNASVRIVGAASEKHAEQMLLLAQFCQCEVSYSDGGNGEDYILSHGTQQLRLSARANKADGAFLRIQARPSESEDLPHQEFPTCLDVGLPVNTVNPVNPVPAPETFDAHGHTWTRHTPGDPCPVADPDALVYVLTSFGGPSEGKPSRAGLCGWHIIKHHNYAWGEIIGWRYATPSTENPA